MPTATGTSALHYTHARCEEGGKDGDDGEDDTGDEARLPQGVRAGEHDLADLQVRRRWRATKAGKLSVTACPKQSTTTARKGWIQSLL
jgi:hypothetical protein